MAFITGKIELNLIYLWLADFPQPLRVMINLKSEGEMARS